MPGFGKKIEEMKEGMNVGYGKFGFNSLLILVILKLCYVLLLTDFTRFLLRKRKIFTGKKLTEKLLY